MSGRSNIYVAILKAAALGQGMRLTADEVSTLASDQGIKEAGLGGLEPEVRAAIEDQEPHGYLNHAAWKGVRP